MVGIARMPASGRQHLATHIRSGERAPAKKEPKRRETVSVVARVATCSKGIAKNTTQEETERTFELVAELSSFNLQLRAGRISDDTKARRCGPVGQVSDRKSARREKKRFLYILEPWNILCGADSAYHLLFEVVLRGSRSGWVGESGIGKRFIKNGL
jgi:hypothetical protein